MGQLEETPVASPARAFGGTTGRRWSFPGPEPDPSGMLPCRPAENAPRGDDHDRPTRPAVPDLTALLLTTRTMEAFLTTLAETMLDISPGCDGCGITLEREGHPLTVASSGRSARRLDEEQ